MKGGCREAWDHSTAPGQRCQGNVVRLLWPRALLEFGTLRRKEVAALAGVVPFPQDSIILKRRWARARPRSTLYGGAGRDQKNPVIRSFYQRLSQAGKTKKVELTTSMRKQLIILNAMVKSGTPWREVVRQPA